MFDAFKFIKSCSSNKRERERDREYKHMQNLPHFLTWSQIRHFPPEEDRQVRERQHMQGNNV
jgi:hypothetical protein